MVCYSYSAALPFTSKAGKEAVYMESPVMTIDLHIFNSYIHPSAARTCIIW
jgi:hypothetical protein